MVLGLSGEAGVIGSGRLGWARGVVWPLAARGGVLALVASRRGTRAVSSAGERFPDTEEVTGSNPVRPTIFEHQSRLWEPKEEPGASGIGVPPTIELVFIVVAPAVITRLSWCQ